MRQQTVWPAVAGPRPNYTKEFAMTWTDEDVVVLTDALNAAERKQTLTTDDDYFAPMRNEPGVKRSKRTWRPLLAHVVTEAMRHKILEALEAAIDNAYPSHAPWRILTEDPDGNDQVYLQVTREEEGQPLHLDGGARWQLDDDGYWAMLSVAVSLVDGSGTFLAGPPVPKIFDKLLQHKHADPNLLAKSMMDVLKLQEAKWPMKPQRNLAGQAVAFHPGEQIHCGRGFDGMADPCNPAWLGRVVLFVNAVPGRHFHKVKHLEVFSTEKPWGLQQGGIKALQVGCFARWSKKKKTQTHKNRHHLT